MADLLAFAWRSRRPLSMSLGWPSAWCSRSPSFARSHHSPADALAPLALSGDHLGSRRRHRHPAGVPGRLEGQDNTFERERGEQAARASHRRRTGTDRPRAPRRDCPQRQRDRHPGLGERGTVQLQTSWLAEAPERHRVDRPRCPGRAPTTARRDPDLARRTLDRRPARLPAPGLAALSELMTKSATPDSPSRWRSTANGPRSPKRKRSAPTESFRRP